MPEADDRLEKCQGAQQIEGKRVTMKATGMPAVITAMTAKILSRSRNQTLFMR